MKRYSGRSARTVGTQFLRATVTYADYDAISPRLISTYFSDTVAYFSMMTRTLKYGKGERFLEVS